MSGLNHAVELVDYAELGRAGPPHGAEQQQGYGQPAAHKNKKPEDCKSLSVAHAPRWGLNDEGRGICWGYGALSLVY